MKKSAFTIGLILLLCFCTSNIFAETDSFQRFRVAISGGYGHRTAHISGSSYSISFPDLPIHYHTERDRKAGFYFELGAAYFFTRNFGAGLKYNTVRHKEQVFVSYRPSLNPGSSGALSFEDQFFWTTFIAPTLNYRFFFTERVLFIGDFAPGYFAAERIGWQNDVRVSAFVVSASFGIDVVIPTGRLIRGLGFQVSLMRGIPTDREYPFGGSRISEAISFQGMDFSVGLRF